MFARRRTAQLGQATVEHVGIAAVVTLLLASVSIWVVQNVRPPAAPPPVIESLASRLDAPAPSLPGQVFHSTALEGAMRHGRDRAPIGRFLRSVRDTVRDVVVIGGPALATSFAGRIRERAVEMIRDPIGTVRDALDEIGRGDPNILRAIRSRIGDLGDYLSSLRGVSREEVIRKVASDLGAAGADIVVEQGRAVLVRAAIRTARERTRRGGAAPPPAPPRR